MGMRNTRGQLGGVLEVFGKIKDTAGTPSVEFTSNLAQAGDVSVTDTGSGDYIIVVKNFKGPRGYAVPMVVSGTISTMASATSVSYSGDTLSVVVKVESDDSTATDSSFYFHIVAF